LTEFKSGILDEALRGSDESGRIGRQHGITAPITGQASGGVAARQFGRGTQGYNLRVIGGNESYFAEDAKNRKSLQALPRLPGTYGDPSTTPAPPPPPITQAPSVIQAPTSAGEAQANAERKVIDQAIAGEANLAPDQKGAQGNIKLNVDVKAPRGTSVNADGDGAINQVKVNRTHTPDIEE